MIGDTTRRMIVYFTLHPDAELTITNIRNKFDLTDYEQVRQSLKGPLRSEWLAVKQGNGDKDKRRSPRRIIAGRKLKDELGI